MTRREWLACTVGDIGASIANALVGGPFGSNLVSSDYVASGVPVIRGQNMGPGRWLGGNYAFVLPEKAEQLRSNLARPGDLIFTQRGTLGQVAIVPDDAYQVYLVSQSQMKLSPDLSRVDPHFIYYVFTSEEKRNYVLQNAIQTGVPHTNLGILRDTPLLLPPLVEQQAIAEVLGSLDDKIDLNRRMNGALEDTVRTIFRSWFVDFDPVSAKMEGRRPLGMDTETAALFPDSLLESELGPIPEAWSVGVLDDVADNFRRQITPSQLEVPKAYIGLEHMPRRSIALGDWATSDGLGSNKFGFERGEILFGKLRPYFHKVGVAPVDGVCSTDILVIAPRAPEWHSFVLGHVSSYELVAHANAASTGTRMPRTNWKDLSSYRIAIPPVDLTSAFQVLVSPLVETIIRNIHEARNLAAIRDTLLPKLISGEVRIRDVEHVVEAALSLRPRG